MYRKDTIWWLDLFAMHYYHTTEEQFKSMFNLRSQYLPKQNEFIYSVNRKYAKFKFHDLYAIHFHNCDYSLYLRLWNSGNFCAVEGKWGRYVYTEFFK